MYTVLMDNLTIHDPSLNDSAHLLFDGVVNKQVNKADSFSFTIYPDNVGYQSLELMTSWVTVYKDGDVIFHGRPLTEDTGWDNEKKIVCEGDLAILNDTIMRPYSFSGTLSDYITMIVNQHNAQVGNDKQITIRTIDNPTITVVRRTGEYKPTMQELFEKVIDYFGGYIVMEYENGTRYLSYKIDSVSGTNQTLEIGKNILDFQRSLSSEALATAVIPLGATDDATGERLTIESVNSGDDYIVSPDAATRGLIYTLYTWDDVTDPSDLLAKAQALLTDLVRVSPRIQLSAVDLSDAGYNIDSIGFFEYVTVQDTAHTVSGQYLITERTYNISAPENDTVTFGSEEKTISGQTAKTQTDLSSMTDAFINKAVEIVAYQTDLLKGGSGGYFIIGTDVDGHPSEIYFMDTDSAATARSVLRINKNGIGFSTTGISGPYYNAWTIDGNLNASYITTGLLQDSAGKNSWNLDTGAFQITDGTINIETTSESYDQIKLRYTQTPDVYDYQTSLQAWGLTATNLAVAMGSRGREVTIRPNAVAGSSIRNAQDTGYGLGFNLSDGNLNLFGHDGTVAGQLGIYLKCVTAGLIDRGITLDGNSNKLHITQDTITVNIGGTQKLSLGGANGSISGSGQITMLGGIMNSYLYVGGSSTYNGVIYVNDSANNIRGQLNYDGLLFKNASGTQTAKYPNSLTASRALVTSTNGLVAVSAVTSTELGYLDGVTSAIQTQLNGKQATITGGVSSVVTSNFTASRALVSNSSGKAASSSVTSTELGYLSGVTSAIQTQLGNKAAKPTQVTNSVVKSTATTNTYSGISCTIPAGKFYTITAQAYYSAKAPTVIILATSSSSVTGSTLVVEGKVDTSNTRAVVTYSGYTASAKTFYLWGKAAAAGNVGYAYDAWYV